MVSPKPAVSSKTAKAEISTDKKEVKQPELLALVGMKKPMIGGKADPRRGMHEDKEHCYKEEAIRRGPSSPSEDEYHPYPWNGKFYPACPVNFRPVGCCMCAPTCPQGMTDLGYKCKKDSYMRHGSYWSCAEGEVQSGDLCYKRCENGQKGNGSSCISECPIGTTECGMLCLRYG